MARITKLPLEKLTELSKTSPSFAPGVENFFKLGGVKEIWHVPLAVALCNALELPLSGDCRREEGLSRKGRELAARVSRLVRESSPVKC
jgi:malonate decarboxylase gamma subunit